MIFRICQKDVEPIPETFQVAKAEPSRNHSERLDKIQEEGLATVSAGLEDVFFILIVGLSPQKQDFPRTRYGVAHQRSLLRC